MDNTCSPCLCVWSAYKFQHTGPHAVTATCTTTDTHCWVRTWYLQSVQWLCSIPSSGWQFSLRHRQGPPSLLPNRYQRQSGRGV